MNKILTTFSILLLSTNILAAPIHIKHVCPNLSSNDDGICVNIKSEPQSKDHWLYMHYYKASDNLPTVIFESGAGDSSKVWNSVIPQLRSYANIVTYDRSNFGKSPMYPVSNTQGRTAQMVVNNLRKMLQEENIKPPYILVGHSLGGLYMQLFAQEYPKEVSGMLLVDSVTPELLMYHWRQMQFPSQDSPEYAETLGTLLSDVQVIYAPPYPKGINDKNYILHNLPLVVLSATYHKTSLNNEMFWTREQKYLAAESTNSKHTTFNCGHYIQKEHPEAVIDAVLQLLKET